MTEAHTAPSLTPPVKGAQKKEAAAPKEPKAPKAPKEAKPPKESNFKKLYPDHAVITLKVEKNPKREGSASYDRFEHYFKHKTVAAVLAAGITYADLSWDVGHGFITVAIPA